MSGPFKATAADVRALADFLDRVTEVSRETGIWFAAYGASDVELPSGSTVKVTRTTGEGPEYAIEDRVGD